MASITALYVNFRNDIKELIEYTDFAITTWLTFGACLQLLSQAWLPPNLSYWLPLVYLGCVFGRSLFNCTRMFTGAFTDVKLGRWSALLPQPEESALTATNNGVVLFLLGARLNHPFGKLAPGTPEIDTVFKTMWKEAETNRDKWSYLGRSPTLFDATDGEGTTVFWLSYWKDLKGLQEFSASAAHLSGQKAYNAKKMPWVGIMHETYFAPRGHWECIYDNMPPTGMGKVQPIVSKGPEGFVFADPLQPNVKASTMFTRMGQAWVREKA